MDGGWTPLPTHPQQYCGPTSLVVGLHSLSSHFDVHLSIHPSTVLTLRIANGNFKSFSGVGHSFAHKIHSSYTDLPLWENLLKLQI